jgi:hypothetical protein
VKPLAVVEGGAAMKTEIMHRKNYLEPVTASSSPPSHDHLQIQKMLRILDSATRESFWGEITIVFKGGTPKLLRKSESHPLD